MNSKISKIVSSILLCSMFTYTLPVFAYTKDETVYSKAYSNGENYNTIVNSHIKNDEENKIINDLSDLLSIENVNSDKLPKQNGNTLVWETDGNDIYYQGESEKELPIECNVKYELDGEEIEAKDIVGKSGKIKIILEYINKDAHIKNIEGKDVTLYTPFVVACGTILDNEYNKNIEISSGKVVDDGSKTTVLGLSFPGMQESLNISSDDFEIPSEIEITMESTNFELNNIITYITPKLIEDSDLEIFNKLDEVYEKANTLQNSSEALEEGANTLKSGANTYSEKTEEFNNAVGQLKNGTNSINLNYSKIDSGIENLNSGSNNLQNGAEALNSGINELTSKLAVLPESVNALYNGSTEVLYGLNGTETSAGLVDGVNGVISSLQSTTQSLEEALTKSANGSQSTIDLLDANNLALDAAIAKLDPNTDGDIIGLLEQQKGINTSARQTYVEAKQTAEQTKAYVEQKAEQSKDSLAKISAGMSNIQGAVTQINIGLGILNESAKLLPDSLAQLSNGSKSIAEGSKSLSNGAYALNQGSSALKSGINSLDENTQKLAVASNQLKDGANTISDGTDTLADGMTKFNEEGIKVICDYINGDLKDIMTRLEKLQELSEEYNNFTMLEDGNEGKVKFIIIMDSLKEEKKAKQEVILNDKEKDKK